MLTDLVSTNSDVTTVPTAGIYHRPALPEALRRIQRILHKLHVRHLLLIHIHLSPNTEWRVCNTTSRLSLVHKLSEDGHIGALDRLWTMYASFDRLRPAEEGVDLELLNLPEGIHVYEGLPDAVWPFVLVCTAPL